MAPERLSRLQRRILAWLAAEDQRTRGTMSASHEELVRALMARGHDPGHLCLADGPDGEGAGDDHPHAGRQSRGDGVDRRGKELGRPAGGKL